jgi:hypothetical protein
VSAVPTPAPSPDLRTDPADGRPDPPDAADRMAEVGERFATHVGVQVDRSGDGSPCDCGATATLTAEAPWLAEGEDAPAPTGALLALVDATARQAASAALGKAGQGAVVIATATSVQHHREAAGAVSATASVPCEGELADRADASGVLRFSVAVDVVDLAGERVATGTVQWQARLEERRTCER